MSLIEDEIAEVSKLCENVVYGSKLIVCLSSLIRVEIHQTIGRKITVCLRFPNKYPDDRILVELKSRDISSKLLDGLTKLCDEKLNCVLGKPQTLSILKFIANYLIENPLCIIYDEILNLKKLNVNNNKSKIIVKQKVLQVGLSAYGGDYYFKINVDIPEEYPNKAISWNELKTNLPQVLVRFLNGQSREIARQCVEQPLRVDKQFESFQPKPSLEKSLSFIILATNAFYMEICPICTTKCLPENPNDINENDSSDNYIERVYCGHIFHQGCLKKYLREPPFPVGGKLCPAKSKHPRSDNPKGNKSDLKNIKNNICGIRLSHDRWNTNIKLAEARWAHQQARVRELEEVIDFLQ